MDRTEEIHRAIGDAHKNLLHISFALADMAKAVQYLHPGMADDLADLAREVDKNSKAISGGHAEIISAQLGESKKFMGQVLTGLLERAS